MDTEMTCYESFAEVTEDFGISQQAFCNAKFAFVRTNALLAYATFFVTIYLAAKFTP